MESASVLACELLSAVMVGDAEQHFGFVEPLSARSRQPVCMPINALDQLVAELSAAANENPVFEKVRIRGLVRPQVF